MRSCSGHGVVALAMLVLAAPGQEQDLTAVLAAFPDDGLPRLLSQLRTAQHDEAMKGLRAIGRRAHPYLLGALRQQFGQFKDLAPAFGGFGPECIESLPVLLLLLEEPLAWQSAVSLLRALGPAARPAVPLLKKLKDPAGRQLAEQLSAGPAVPAAVPAPVAAVVDQQWRAGLLALLNVPADRARWWPALQALSAIDERAVGEAAAVIAGQALGSEDAAVRDAARELLNAIRCRHAAVVMTSLGEVVKLPPDLLVAELRRHVLAQRLQPFNPSTTEVTVAAALGADQDREVRWLMVLGAVLQTITGLPPTRSAPDQVPMAAWLGDADDGVRQLARMLERARSAAVAMAQDRPAGDDLAAQLRDLTRLGDDQVRLLPVEKVRELLALAKAPAAAPRPKAEGNVAEDLVRIAANRPSGPAAHLAHEVVNRIVTADALVVTRLGELSADERRTLVTACLGARGGAPGLHGWLLDQLDLLPPDKLDFGRPVPIELLPTLRSRLVEGHDLERTVALWRQACTYQNWADAAAESVEAFAAAVPRLSPEGCQRVASVLGVTGVRGRREMERLVLDPALPATARTEVVKRLFNNAQQVPPSGAFVIKLLEHADAELRSRGIGLALHVREERDAIAAILMRRWQDADAAERRSLGFTLARMQVAAAVPLLAAELERLEGPERIRMAARLLDADQSHTAAVAMLTSMLDGTDEELRKTVWAVISQSPGASAVFLERAVANLDKGETIDRPHTYREFRVIVSAMERRRDDAMQQLTRLQRHRDRNLADAARQWLEQLNREQRR